MKITNRELPENREIEVKDLNDWDDFEKEVYSIFIDLEDRRNRSKFHISNHLFRGHTQESWKLRTTLERFSERDYSITDYYKILLSIEPAIASYTSKSWNLDPNLNIDEEYCGPPPGYEFMVHLRHHGFPSPLLDWSRSPYIAAVFAFQPRIDKEESKIAIYAYVEYYEGLEKPNLIL